MKLKVHVRTVDTPITPYLRWVGGKQKLVRELERRMPRAYRDYYEPFAGSAALFLALPADHFVPGRVFELGDINEHLMRTYTTLVHAHESVSRRLAVYGCAHGERHYARMRDRWNLWHGRRPGRHLDLKRESARRAWHRIDDAAAFIYLNRACFNGLYRVNKYGEYNVPMGNIANPKIWDPDHLRRVSERFAKAILVHRSAFFVDAGKDDFVYFDPPYVPTSITASFTSYDPSGFGLQQQEDLARTVRRLVDKGAKVMVSNSATPLVKKLYKGFRFHRITRAGTVSSNPNKRERVSELIITTY